MAQDAELPGHPLHVNAEPATREVDTAKVERIVDNLLASAIKHTPPGTDIWVRLTEDGTEFPSP